MLPGMELMGCQMAVPAEVMHHVVRVESSYNPYAIGVVGGHLVRQPRNLPEALATVRMLENRGYNFSLGLAQVNRHNLARFGLDSYEKAFETCPNLQAGARILTECYHRSGRDWGKSFSCYYSGNFVTGYKHGYVQKIYASMRSEGSQSPSAQAIEIVNEHPQRAGDAAARDRRRAVGFSSTQARRIAEFSGKPYTAQAPHQTQAIAPTQPQPQAADVAGSQPSQMELPYVPQVTTAGKPAAVSGQPRHQDGPVAAARVQRRPDAGVDAAFVF